MICDFNKYLTNSHPFLQSMKNFKNKNTSLESGNMFGISRKKLYCKKYLKILAKDIYSVT